MKILHITPHLGGGIGTVVRGWLGQDQANEHKVACLDYLNQRSKDFFDEKEIPHTTAKGQFNVHIDEADIVVVHWWDHPLLAEFFGLYRPPMRLVFWCHKNYSIPINAQRYPDKFIVVAPAIGGRFPFIWSTGGIDEYLQIEPEPHGGFNVGYIGTVDYKKLHPNFLAMCMSVEVSDVKFTVIGDRHVAYNTTLLPANIQFIGQVNDVRPWLANMDVFGYPLCRGHYGTCEQVLGEAMAAGVVPVVLDNKAEKYIVRDGIDGFVARDVVEYSEMIASLHRHPALRVHMGLRARERAEKLYSLDNMLVKWHKVFTELIIQPKKERAPLEIN